LGIRIGSVCPAACRRLALAPHRSRLTAPRWTRRLAATLSCNDSCIMSNQVLAVRCCE
jgi:hypothetical protein